MEKLQVVLPRIGKAAKFWENLFSLIYIKYFIDYEIF